MKIKIRKLENPKQRIIGIGYQTSLISKNVKWISIYLWKKVIEIWFGLEGEEE